MIVPHIMSMVFSYLITQMATWQVQITTREGQVFTFPQKKACLFPNPSNVQNYINTNSELDLQRLDCTHLVLF